MVYKFKGRKNICTFGNVITLQIILRNEIPGNEITACSKVQVPKIKYGYQIKKESSISKIHVACSNTNLFSFCYEPRHVRKPGIFIIRGILRTLDSCQT